MKAVMKERNEKDEIVEASFLCDDGDAGITIRAPIKVIELIDEIFAHWHTVAVEVSKNGEFKIMGRENTEHTPKKHLDC